MIKSSTLDALANAVDIIDVIEPYVELKKSGGLFKGLSPFQNEKTPSFVVTPSKNIWHDFSSGQGGDTIKFIQLIEGLTFPESVEKLCSIYNITVEHDSEKKESISSASLEIYKDWCVERLQTNSKALQYLKDRGLTDKSINEFEIGYSPSSIETIQFVKSSVITVEDAIAVGIIDRGDNGLYSRFIERIIFPIRNHIGKLCGYSGRTISGHQAKYVNTKDTPLFHKSSLMYGFDKAKEFIGKEGRFILSEGQMDVVMQHQAGIRNSFASMGTALTSSHIKIISRFAKKGTVAYDGDAPGIKAAFKAAELFIISMIDVKIVIFSDDKDPADLISEGRIDEVKALINNGIPAIDFCVDSILSKYDLDNPFEKANSVKEIENFANKMNPIVMKNILEKASSKLNYIVKSSNNHSTNKKEYSDKDIREKELIKNAIVSRDRKDIELVLSAKKCFSLKDEMIALESMDFTNTTLTAILLDENIIASANLCKDMILFKIWCMKSFMKRVQENSKASAKDKILKIRKAQMRIKELETKLKG